MQLTENSDHTDEVSAFVFSVFLSQKALDFNTTMSLFTILINAMVGLGMIMMNMKYNNALDEMQRKVAIDAKAIALGVGVVGGLSYEMLDAANVIPFDAEIGHLVMLIGVTYFVAIIVGSLRYK
jgi:hypothetical protein